MPLTSFNEKAQGIWQPWVQAATTGTTETNAWGNAWKVWTETNTATSAELTKLHRVVWTKWQEPMTGTGGRIRRTAPPPLSKRDELIARERRRSRELRKRNAERRARELLLDHLTPEQRCEWEEGAYFHVETASGRRRYRIDRGHVGNVRVVLCDEPPPVKADRVRAGSRLCAHAYGDWLPEEDHVLAQKLLLESEGGEAEFLRMANVMPR